MGMKNDLLVVSRTNHDISLWTTINVFSVITALAWFLFGSNMSEKNSTDVEKRESGRRKDNKEKSSSSREGRHVSTNSDG